MATTSDPYYKTGAAGFIRWCLETYHGIELVLDDRLNTRAAADPADRVIWARPGLALPDFHWMVARAGLWMYHPEAVPEFNQNPQPVGPSANGMIIPFPRLDPIATPEPPRRLTRPSVRRTRAVPLEHYI